MGFFSDLSEFASDLKNMGSRYHGSDRERPAAGGYGSREDEPQPESPKKNDIQTTLEEKPEHDDESRKQSQFNFK